MLKNHKNMKPQKEILTAEETMELLDISRSTFDRLRREGTIKVYTLRRRLYCKYSEIMESLENSLSPSDEAA